MQLKTKQLKAESGRGNVQYAHWDSWNAGDYLQTYFSVLGQDSIENLKFLIRELRRTEKKIPQKILDFGAGPTVFAGLVAAPFASEIHISDYLQSNLDEVRKWIKKDQTAFDWNQCLAEIIRLEKGKYSEEIAMKRADELRHKTTGLFRSDASLSFPIMSNIDEKYPIVITNFCADSATSSKEVWKAYMKNIFNLVEDDGQIILAALRNCQSYRNGPNLFPSANINEYDVAKIFKEGGFDKASTVIEVKSVPECTLDGFSTIILASATKRRPLRIIVDKIIKDSLVSSDRKNN